MSKRVKTALMKYGFGAAFCGGMAWLYVSLRPFDAMTLKERYRTLCDAFTVPGTVLVMVGILLWLSNNGAVDGLGYVMSRLIHSLIPGGRLRSERYADYVERRREKPLHGFAFLFVTGGVCMAVALVFMALFYSI